LAVDAIEKNLLIHELQLGEQLNECIHSERRSDFSLMLAMLADDVREQSQFILPHTSAKDAEAITDNSLRKQFHLPKKAALALENVEQIGQYNQAGLIESNEREHLHLTDILAPKPLAFRNDAKHICSDVIGNTSLHCQLKLKQQQTTPINKPLAVNVQGWLDAIQTSLVKSSLISTADPLMA
jgi:hypothetical protein